MADREKVIRGLEVCTSIADGESCPKDCPYYQEVCYGYDQVMRDALALLKEQEGKTGHWIEQEDYALDTYYDCSVCGESWSTIEGTPWENGMNYCPHCGAKLERR